MKKSALAIITAALAMSTAAQAAEVYNKDGNKLDFYGRVKAMHYFSDTASNDVDKSYVRLGFKGQTQINDLLTGYGQWEYQFGANKSESQGSTGDKTRLGFAGLKAGDFGSFDYGRNFGLIYDVESITDMMPEFGATGYTGADVFMLQRAGGLATYRNSNFFGLVDNLKFALQYQGKNETNRSSDGTSNGDGMSASVSYKFFDALTATAAYSSSNRTVSQKNSAFGQGDKADAWATGLKYDDNGVYLGATYAETRNMNSISGSADVNGVETGFSGFANKMTNLEVYAHYQFDFGLRPSIAYVQTKAKDIESGVGDGDVFKFVDIGALYAFNKNMSVFVDYKINLLDEDNKLNQNSDDIVAVGMTYQF